MESNYLGKVIGSGGFGLVVQFSNKPIVAKLLYKSSCDDAKIEYNKHLDIYTSFNNIKNEKYLNDVCISIPLGFDSEEIIYSNYVYSCYYIMTLLHSLGNEGLYHIIDNSHHNMNKQIGKVFTLPISQNNPSRGFFANYDYLQSNILNKYDGYLTTIKRIMKCMGFAFGVILFVAEYLPEDVEYALGKNPDTNEICL
jgi:hypothetical protein